MSKDIISVADIPYMAEQWDCEKNVDDIHSTPSNLKKPMYWKCRKCGYAWSASPAARLASTGQCPCCELNKVNVKGINDLLTLNPEAADSYDFEKISDIDIYKLGPGSHKSVHWKCKKCGYEWACSVKSRTNASFKCPCCDSNKVIKKGVNDVFTVVPDLMNWYDFEKNTNIDIYSQGLDSNVLAHWKCDECGRKWTTSILTRIKKAHGKYEVVGCPHYNTVKRKSVEPVSNIPELMRFWNFDKNALKPTLTPSNATKDAFWKCNNCGYEWRTTILAQTQGTGKCLCCELYRVTRKGFTDLFTFIPDAKNSYNFEKNKDIDVYALPMRSSVPLWWKCPDCGYEWQASIRTRISGKEGKYTLNRCQQCYFHDSERITPVSAIQKLARFWDYKKNNRLDVNLTSAYSSENAFWVCRNCGYKWQATIRSRANASDNCPCCDSGRAISKGFNDVLTLVPEISNIYDFEKNSDIDIYAQGVGSRQNASFRCRACGYEWESLIGDRVRKEKDGTYRVVSCPVCDNKRHRKMSYAEQYPELDLLYDAKRNGRSLTSITSYETTTIKLWWTCKACGNSFDSRLQSMINALDTKTKGCPYCSKTKLIDGSSFADIHPELIIEYDSNNTIDPYTVFPNAKNNVKWICRNNCEHRWLTSFAQRHRGMGKCPICERTKPVEGINTFVDVYPEYTKLWSPNNGRTPNETLYNSSLWLRWICPTCNGEYGAYIESVISEEESCPFCENRRVLPGFNSLAAINPEIAKLWSADNELDADHIRPDLTLRGKWLCLNCGGEYTASVKDAVSGDASCPFCEGRKVLSGYNSFAAKHPELMSEWDYTNNYLLTDPDHINDNSSIHVWWGCQNDSSHKYRMPPSTRLMFQKRHKEPCPNCKGRRRKKRHFV